MVHFFMFFFAIFCLCLISLKLNFDESFCETKLLAINNEIKAHRVAVYAYKLNLLNSVMSLVNKVRPMSTTATNAI